MDYLFVSIISMGFWSEDGIKLGSKLARTIADSVLFKFFSGVEKNTIVGALLRCAPIISLEVPRDACLVCRFLAKIFSVLFVQSC